MNWAQIMAVNRAIFISRCLAGRRSSLYPCPPEPEDARRTARNQENEALDWIRRAPFRDEEVELRPLFEAQDFGAEFTPELRAQEERQRAKIEQHSRNAPH